MNGKESTLERGIFKNIPPLLKRMRLSGLQADMTISYVWVSVAAVLVLQIVGFLLNGVSLDDLTKQVFRGVLISLAITAPIGGIFGLLTTRGLVHRIRNLVSATTRFADGNYVQRVHVTRADELGQLELQFNRMAEKLVESITQGQALAEQNARMQERSRISRELHDAISQDLFSLRMLGGGLQTAIASGSSLQPYIETLEQATGGMIREMHALLLELRPIQLEHLGLRAALEELAAAYSTRLGIAVTTDIAHVTLDAKSEHTLLRIAQEALTNVARHADATMITISLQNGQKDIEFICTDDGKGFELRENEAQHGLGLRLMQERVQELQGTFLLQSVPGQGTRLNIRIPQEQTP